MTGFAARMNMTSIATRASAQALALLLAYGFLACAHTNQAQIEATQASVASNGAGAPVAARFVETWRQPEGAPFQKDWFFIRSDTRIETAQRDYAEIWERDDRQEMTFKRVFHGDRKVIEYTSGQLRAERRRKDWSALATILDEKTLAHLEPRGATKVSKQPAVRYVGTLGDEHVEVVWLTQQALPAKIERSHRGATYTLELKDLRTAPDPSWPTISWEQTAEYEILDAADLGDREYEPFVRKVLDMDAGPGGHSHAD